MLSEFEKKIADYVTSNGLLDSARRLLLAVSGGIDSTALLHVTHALKVEKILNAELLCAHVNHQLRANDADLDEEFVIAEAAKLKMAVTTKRVDGRGFARSSKLSIETAARQLRIHALGEIARDNHCDVIITAHQKNDNAETIVQRMARGTGFRGLAGIWPQRIFADGTTFVRPLLCVGRDEIISYLHQKNLQWRCDRTNTDCAYRRNFIRHRLLPELQRNANRPIVEQLSELARSARGFCGLVHARADELWPEVAASAGDEITLDVETFLTQAPPVKVELVRRCLEHIGCGERYVTQRHYEDIMQLARHNVTGRKVQLPGDFVVLREYGELILGPAREFHVGQAPLCDGGSVTLDVPGSTRFGQYLIEATIFKAGEAGLERFIGGKTGRVERFDLDKINLPLVIRFRQPGDRFVPLGQRSGKKLDKFLTAQRVPHRTRNQVLVITDSENIVWVCPVRMSEQAKVTNGTRTVLQLQIAGPNDSQNSVDRTEPGQ